MLITCVSNCNWNCVSKTTFSEAIISYVTFNYSRWDTTWWDNFCSPIGRVCILESLIFLTISGIGRETLKVLSFYVYKFNSLRLRWHLHVKFARCPLNVFYCLHVSAGMKFHPEMNLSLSKRQGWDFILGWKTRKKDVEALHLGMKFYNDYTFLLNFYTQYVFRLYV